MAAAEKLDLHAFPKLLQGRHARRLIAEVRQIGRVDTCKCHDHPMPQAELGFKARARRSQVTDAFTAGGDTYDYPPDVSGSQAVACAQMPCGLDRGMCTIAGGVILEKVAAQVQTSFGP